MPNPGRRNPPAVPTGSMPTPERAWGLLLELWKHVVSNHIGIPGGFFDIDPLPINANNFGSPGDPATGWTSARHTHPVEVGSPSNPTGKTASEGTSGRLMRSDATIAQGIVTDKGDLLTHDGSTAERVAVGADALLLTADSAETTGLRWGPLVLSPAQITANTNDYAPGRANVYRLSTDASRNLTGLVAGTDGEVRRVVNVGAQPLVLKHQDAGSVAANEFLCPGAADITLAANEMAELLYDSTTARWRAFKL